MSVEREGGMQRVLSSHRAQTDNQVVHDRGFSMERERVVRGCCFWVVRGRNESGALVGSVPFEEEGRPVERDAGWC